MFQQISIIGRLGRDPEMRYTPTGTAVCTFSVATDRQYNDSQGKQVKEVGWFRVQVWSKMAEACNNYLQKGKLVMVQGRLAIDPATGGPRTWAGQDGLMRTNFEIVASTVKFLSSKDDKSTEPAVEAEGEAGDAAPSEEIPF